MNPDWCVSNAYERFHHGGLHDMIWTAMLSTGEAQYLAFGPDGLARSISLPPEMYERLAHAFAWEANASPDRGNTLRIESDFGTFTITRSSSSGVL